MAFDEAASSSSRSATPRLEGPAADIQAISQLVWQLAQTTQSVDTATVSLGTPADVVSLRKRIQKQQATGLKLQADIETGLRKLRVAFLQSPDSSNQRQLKKLEEQYAREKDRFSSALSTCALKQRQFAPQADPPEAASRSGAGARGIAGPAGTSRRNVQQQDEQQIVIELQNFTAAVDLAISEENAEDAAAIATESVGLRDTMRDLNALVVEQGTSVAKVEENVDKATDKVQAGNVDLTTAAKYQSSYRKKCCAFWILLLLAAGIAVVLVLHQVYHKF